MILIQCFLICWECVCEMLRQRESVDQRGLMTSKADLDSDHVLVSFWKTSSWSPMWHKSTETDCGDKRLLCVRFGGFWWRAKWGCGSKFGFRTMMNYVKLKIELNWKHLNAQHLVSAARDPCSLMKAWSWQLPLLIWQGNAVFTAMSFSCN